MPTDPLNDLVEARSKIEATREALQAALDGQEALEAARRVIERLEQLGAEVVRVEGVVRSPFTPDRPPTPLAPLQRAGGRG